MDDIGFLVSLGSTCATIPWLWPHITEVCRFAVARNRLTSAADCAETEWPVGRGPVLWLASKRCSAASLLSAWLTVEAHYKKSRTCLRALHVVNIFACIGISARLLCFLDRTPTLKFFADPMLWKISKKRIKKLDIYVLGR